MVVKHMHAVVQDPQLRQQLTPSYTIGCKRILASDDYYPALAAPNVKLVPAGLKKVGLWQGGGGRGTAGCGAGTGAQTLKHYGFLTLAWTAVV